jgi:hypothetical protein
MKTFPNEELGTVSVMPDGMLPEASVVKVPSGWDEDGVLPASRHRLECAVPDAKQYPSTVLAE